MENFSKGVWKDYVLLQEVVEKERADLGRVTSNLETSSHCTIRFPVSSSFILRVETPGGQTTTDRTSLNDEDPI